MGHQQPSTAPPITFIPRGKLRANGKGGKEIYFVHRPCTISMRKIPIILLFGTGLPVLAQDQQIIDSLRHVLATASRDTIRMKAHLDLAGEWLGNEPDSAYAHCMAARAIAEHTGRPQDIGETEGWLGYLEEQRGNIGPAIAHYEVALRMARKVKDSAGEATVLNNLAAIYKDQGRIGEALTAHERSLAIRRSRSDTVGIASSLNNIGLLLYDQGRITEAMEHYVKALRFFELGRDNDGIATALVNIAGIHKNEGNLDKALDYFRRALTIQEGEGDHYSMATSEDNIGDVLEAQGHLAEAVAHYRRALELHKDADDVRGEGYSLRNIAGAELSGNAPDSALAHARQSYERLRSADDKRGQASALWMEGRALMALGRPEDAEAKGRDALTMAQQLGYPQLIRDAAHLLEDIYRSSGDWRRTVEMQDLYITMRDSVSNDDARRTAIKQQFQYAFEKKQALLKAEQDKKDAIASAEIRRRGMQRNASIVGLILMVVFAGVFLAQRNRISKARKRSDELLLNILPEEVAEELKAKGEAKAVQFDEVTVLFTDFKGFTALSEAIPPAQLVRDLNACFSAFDHICEKYGIEKIKTIGDAFMAAGGLPTPNTTHAADTVNAALEMRDFIAADKARKIAGGLPHFEVRIGIHTGPVVAGIVGVKKFQYDIWGDTVNTASRMESSGEPGKVNISETTYRLVVGDQLSVVGTGGGSRTTDNQQLTTTPAFAFTPRGKVQAKGKGELEMYFVERRIPGA
jgi:class 3 adenylate cyclase